VSDRLIWDRDGRDWPNRAFSRFVTAGGLVWHVQVMGEGPVVLLIHGTGASTHSFRKLAAILASRFTVVAPDLPGHGFTATPSLASGFSLPGVAGGVAALLQKIALKPVLAVGHSAGAAIAARMTLDGAIVPHAVVSLNGALLPFPGMANDFFSPVARFLASSTLTAKAFTVVAGSRPSVEKMLRSTGSSIDAEDKRFYVRLVGNASHVHGALALMANWNLRPLTRDLAHFPARLILVTGSKDGMVPPSESYRVRSIVPAAELVSLKGLGHLAHEERPEEIASLIERIVPHETTD
jgi:magnesium chelatase accessory protein